MRAYDRNTKVVDVEVLPKQTTSRTRARFADGRRVEHATAATVRTGNCHFADHRVRSPLSQRPDTPSVDFVRKSARSRRTNTGNCRGGAR